MSAAIQNLLDQAGSFPGLLAAGVFTNHRGVAARIQDPTMTEADLGKIWKHLSEATEVTQHHRIPPIQMRWIFERVLVDCVKRTDGLQLSLIFARSAAPQLNQEAIESLFNEFRNLPDK